MSFVIALSGSGLARMIDLSLDAFEVVEVLV